MGKYSVKKLNIPTVHQDLKDKLTDEQIAKREKQHDLLRKLGVYVALYTDGSIKFPGHPDGIHNYLADAHEAQKLVESEQELPQDLLDRLAYYKPIMDKQFEMRK